MQENSARQSQPRKAAWRSYFVKLPYAVIAHPNYLTLSPKTQQILIDIHRQIQRCTNFGLDPLPSDGFPYSYGHCIVDTHRNTFARSLRTLIEREWICESDQLDIDKEVRWYHPLSAWKKWKPTDTQRKRLRSLKARIERREMSDRSTTCTILMHRPAAQNDNPALKFWARDGDYLHSFDAPLTLDQKEKINRGAQARAKQLLIQEEPQKHEPLSGQELADFEATALRFREERARTQVPSDPPPRNNTSSAAEDDPPPPPEAA